MSERGARAALAVVVLPVVWAGAVAAQTSAGGPALTNLGSPATPEEIADRDPIVGPGGEGLPAGSGTAVEGRALYDRRCAACHGATGREGPDDRLAGGQGSLAGGQARKTVGSYWPAATTLWDYVNRAMPFNQPGSLAPDEVYAVVAYVLYLNGIVGGDDLIDAGTLPRIEMPNRDGFVPDPRPDLAEASGRARRPPVAVEARVAVEAPIGAAAPRAPAVPPSAGSVLDGVFTAAQASRGERTFREVCAACHDPGEFSGGRFRIGWVGRPVGELFETISTLMPEADPGSLSRGEYAAIVAYLLQLNDYPAGDADLPSNGRALGRLEIVARPAP